MANVPGVIKIIDWFELSTTIPTYLKQKTELEPTFNIVLEKPIDCMDFFDFISSKKYLKEDTAKIAFKEIFTIVYNCFEKGIIHRDIKDENILVTLKENEPDKFYLIDFGSAAFVKSTLFTDFEGTRLFTPPEYLLTQQYDGELATVWSLGVLLFSMLTGVMPWEDDFSILCSTEFDVWFPKGIYISRDCQRLVNACLTKASKRIKLKGIKNHVWLNT